MKMKLNKAKKLQFYDSKGRFAKMPQNFEFGQKQKLSKSERKRQKQLNIANSLREKAIAANRKNPLLLYVFDSINSAMPNEIIDIECDMDSKYTSVVRNLDIVTKGFIIEVKSGSSKGKDRQLYAQLLYAQKINKKALVYAPNIDSNSESRYSRKGINIFRNINKMIKYMKENQK